MVNEQWVDVAFLKSTIVASNNIFEATTAVCTNEFFTPTTSERYK
jgi:hypothetical protein